MSSVAQSSSREQKVEWWQPGGKRRGQWDLLFKGYRQSFSFARGKSPKDGLHNGEGGKFFVTCILPQLKTKSKGETLKLVYSQVLSQNFKSFFFFFSLNTIHPYVYEFIQQILISYCITNWAVPCHLFYVIFPIILGERYNQLRCFLKKRDMKEILVQSYSVT